MARILILGGTRNLGHVTALSLLNAGHQVTILNRGQTADELPDEVERLRADRHDDSSMRHALRHRSFDAVLDNTTYTETDARQAVDLFDGRAGRYFFVSSGQVYLVREDLPRPFRETDYDGPVMPEPPRESADHPAWLYGIDKRLAEQVFSGAFEKLEFPVTTLRLPMVASERDHYGRIQGYIARMLDGGPILIPDETGLPLRHVYVSDVARVVTSLVTSDIGVGKAFNVSCGESVSLDAFLEMLKRFALSSSEIVRIPRRDLGAQGLLPDCSPFSGKWMSELDNSLSVLELRAMYVPPSDYLQSIVDDYRARWIPHKLVPESYKQRNQEVEFFRQST